MAELQFVESKITLLAQRLKIIFFKINHYEKNNYAFNGSSD